ncbi:MAG: hypothetical protein ACOYNR_01805 [Blastocatellia bacterium]
MIPSLRQRFNTAFSDDRYHRFLQALEAEVGAKVEFRVSETPVFLPASLVEEMVAASRSIVAQLNTPAYRAESARSIPPAFDVPNEGDHPHFVQVDFALVWDEEAERVVPRLIELQGCASLHAFQFLLAKAYREQFDLGPPSGLANLLEGLTDEAYLEQFRRVVLRGHDPAEVILLEIDPLRQKTYPDFAATRRLLGVEYVCVTEVIQRGRKLFYRRQGQEVEIRRIYNRAIIDELVRKGVTPSFDLRADLAVEWAGHPNWYFRWSKFSLPSLRHPTVPRAWFLDQLPETPSDLENFVLKPLFSFAGLGVRIDVQPADLAAIPATERGDYLLQEKVAYHPLIETPDEPSKVEVRVMLFWPEGVTDPIPVTTLIRLGKGAMMGVDFNRNRTWVGSSAAFFETAGFGGE